MRRYKEKHKGQISIYSVCMLSVLLVLVVTVFSCIRVMEAKGKGAQVASHSIQNMEGDYQSQLFERYGIFAIDTNYGGRGIGFMEERMEQYMEETLDSSSPFGKGLYHFEVYEVEVAETYPLMEEGLDNVQLQIQQEMSYDLPLYLIEELEQQWKGEDEEDTKGIAKSIEAIISEESEVDMGEEIPREMLERLNLLEQLEELGIEAGEEITLGELVKLAEEGNLKLLDIREVIKEYYTVDILSLILPEEFLSISRNEVKLSGRPSEGKEKQGFGLFSAWGFGGSMLASPLSPRGLIQVFNNMKPSTYKGINTQLHEELYGLTYALTHFSYYGEEVEGEHELAYEVEYLIAGQDSDYKNMSAIARELSYMRLVPNGIYAFSDKEMAKEAQVAAVIILAPFGLSGAYKEVSYVILAGWAYGESLLEVRSLLKGHRVPVVKNKDNWRLSLMNIASLNLEELSGDEEAGLCYRDYLLLFLAAREDRGLLYYRMLDVMEMNLNIEDETFAMENCIYGFQGYISYGEGGYQWELSEEMIYGQ